MPEGRKLNIRQRRWCELVVRGVSRTDAVRELWPKITAPAQKAYALGQLPHLREYMARLDAQHLEQANISRTEIVLNLARIGRFDPRKLENQDGSPKKLAELDDDTAAAIAGVDVEDIAVGEKHVGQVRKYRVANKVEAWRELATIAGLKRQEGAPPTIGPGLTVIVQQAVHVQGQPGSSVMKQQRVEVALPPPSRATE